MTDAALAVVDQKRLAVASQWQLMWWAFRRHRLAMIGLVITVFLYIIAAVPGFFAVNDPNRQNARAAYHPPQSIHLFDRGADGSLSVGLYFRPYVLKRDPQTLAAIYTEDPARKVAIRFFGQGYQYKLFGFFPTTTHPDRLRQPELSAVHLRRGPVGALRVVAHHGRRADLALGGPRRRVPVADAGRGARRHLRLLRRADRLRGAAGHRVRARPADDPDLARARRGAAAGTGRRCSTIS